MIGTTIGRYRVLSKLGEGGMGSVWLAEDPVLGRSVALKVLPEGSAHSAEARERLLREARAACRLHHPGIATVYEAGEEDGRIYLAFEHVDGETVAERVKRDGPLPVEEALRIAREIAEALSHAHGQGVVHRDVTSRNVMLDASGRAKLVDFGLAYPEGETRVTRPATTPGTIGYAAPEVVKGERGGRPADLWGLGVVLYEMLTGKLPFERDRAGAVLYAVVHEEAEPPRRHRKDLPPELEAVVLRALAKDPGQRFADTNELIDTLQEDADTGGVRSRSRQLRRAALVAVPVVAGAAFAVWWTVRDSSPRFDSVAVLPFSLAGESAQESAYLATGLADALVTRLGRVPDLRVTPWVTSRRYPPAALPFPDIGRELNVESLVVGTFREEEGKLHIDLKLVEAPTGDARWSGEFEDTKMGLLALQEEITVAVARSVRNDLTPEEAGALLRRPTDRADAYDHYLKGAAAMQADTREGKELALAHFETALAIDPRLAEAWVGAGAVQNERYWLGWGDSDNATLAIESFRRALEIEPDMYPALRGLIQIYWKIGPNEECLRIAREVREHSSAEGRASVEALLTQAEGYLWGGLTDKAVPLLQVVNELDPVNGAGHWLLVLAYANLGDAARTIATGDEYLRSFGEDASVHHLVAGAYRCQGDGDASLTHYRRSLDLFGDNVDPPFLLASVLAFREFAGLERAREVAEDGIRQLESRLPEDAVGHRLSSYVACLYAIVGNPEKVLEHGRRALEMRPPRKVPLWLAFAYAELGHRKTANDFLLEISATLRSAGGVHSSPDGVTLGTGIHFEGFWLSECDTHANTPRAVRELPAFGEFLQAVRQEQKRRRVLYGG